MDAQTATSYEQGLKLYDEGEPLDEVLQFFESLQSEAHQDPRVAVSLSWLYTLTGQKDKALRWAKAARSVPQARFNLVLAMLAFGEKGVRERFEDAVHYGGADGVADAIENLRDAIERKGGKFPAAEKLTRWLEEAQREVGPPHEHGPDCQH